VNFSSLQAKPEIVRRSSDGVETLPRTMHYITRRVLQSRGVLASKQLDISIRGLYTQELLSGIEKAEDLIVDAICFDRKILIIGDYDADGATSIAVAIRALRSMGAQNVEYLVPNRFGFGYGLTIEIVEVAKKLRPDLIITVDNGVSSINGVAAAKASGISVLVTDHHLPGEVLPSADAIINPNLSGDEFPSKFLAGVGVIFYVMAAVRRRLREASWFKEKNIEEPKLSRLLDLVALGTIADVVPLDQNNRRLVDYGLQLIRQGQGQPGISAIIEAANKQSSEIRSGDLGFIVGPRLNAAGRLADMSLGVECLLSDDPVRCKEIAVQLSDLNIQRREIEGEMREKAFSLIAESLVDEVSLAPAVCLFHEDWHQGVVGIVAARVKEQFYRPTIAFALTDNNVLKGSARSIQGVHIRDIIARVSSRSEGLVISFGGHAAAAGLSIMRSNFNEFTEKFEDEVSEVLDDDTLNRTISTDGELLADDMSLALAEELESVSPWGQGFPEPRFDGVFTIKDKCVVGSNHARLTLEPVESGKPILAIMFGGADESWFSDAIVVKVVYRLTINRFRNIKTLQLVIDYAEAA
jgi:single-stranded-DNA-specific exonuclease